MSCNGEVKDNVAANEIWRCVGSVVARQYLMDPRLNSVNFPTPGHGDIFLFYCGG